MKLPKSGAILIRMRFIMPAGLAYLPSALWPLLWIWATLWREDRGWGMRHIADDQQALHQRLETVVQQLEQVQREVDF
jgi:hypothetical protein